MLVYLGDIPEYVLSNAVYLSEVFPDQNVVLITDSKAQATRVDSLGLNSWICSEVRHSWKKVSDVSAHKSSFRNDFWFKTVGRFYALYEYMNTFPEQSLLHVEADVWLSHSFPIHLFAEMQGRIAYPLKNSSEGIASTLFVEDSGALQILIDYTEKCFEINPFSTDVSVLGSFHKDFPSLFENLPTLPLGAPILGDSASDELSDLLSQNFEKYQGIFDASTLGIHYTGVDPRNNWGFRTLFDTAGAPMDLKKACFSMVNGRPFLKYAESEAEIFSLHVHSKDLRMFSAATFPNRLQALSSFNQKKRRNEFDGLNSLSILVKTLLVRVTLRLRQVYRDQK